MKYIYQSIISLIILSIIVGIIYPGIIYIIGQTAFPFQANGSIIYDKNNKPTGSLLIGQQFTKEKYFWSRPSATANYPYNALASGGSNLGPLNPQLESNVAQYATALKASASNTIPVDLVTASGSGLDPEISLAAAYYQISRVAQARHMTVDAVKALVNQNTQYPILGFLGETRVNVLSLNIALDKYKGN